MINDSLESHTSSSVCRHVQLQVGGLGANILQSWEEENEELGQQQSLSAFYVNIAGSLFPC